MHFKTTPVAAAVLAAAFFCWATEARGQNPYDALQRDNARQVSRAGRAAEGAIPLLRLWRNWNWASPSVTAGLLEQLARDRRLSPARRAYVRSLVARGRVRRGDLDGARRLIRELGYVTGFRVVGPFDNEGKRGFRRELPPEAQRLEAWDGHSQYAGRERPVSWRPYPSTTALFGYVDFDAVFRPNENVCGFAETFVRSDGAQPLTVWAGGGGALKVWWNGQLVLTDERYRQPHQDRDVAMVAARAGYNRLLVKTCVTSSTWGFYLRLGDATGAPASGVTVDASRHRRLGQADSQRLPTAPPTPLATLETRAAGGGASAQSLEDLARMLAYTGADDPVERRARQLAARAADAEPTVARLQLAADLADERGEVQRFGRRAIALAPRSPEARLLWGRILAGGPSPEEALPVLASVQDQGTARMRAVLVRARILRSLGLNETARREVERAAATRAPDAPGWILQRASAAEATGHTDQALVLRARAVQARYDLITSRRGLAIDALRRDERPEVVEHLEALRQLLPMSRRNFLFVARLYEGLGQNDAALAAFEQARTLAPEDATVLAAQGRLLLRLRQPGRAVAAFRQVLALRPQDRATRELLEQMEPEERLDEGYAVDADTLLARRVEQAGYPTTVLQDLTVNTVFDNGLGSTFRQFAAQAHDEEGARRLRTYSIQFDPGSQRVDVRQARVYRHGEVLEATRTFEQQLGEPWYRIYYDTRAMVVAFPDLEPGDSIEIQYRLDDIAHRNLFADYYGDMHFLQGFSPTRRMDYVLITPRSRLFFTNEPHLPGLTHERTERGGQRIDHFHAEDIPAIRSEQGMPGMTEVSPYLHVSTYRTWEEVGRWWWGLIEDQLQPDEALRNTVRDLVRGAPDLRTKVQRIHNWVIRNTRYVALEFGIHGFQPYRVALTVQRGFGDCKDKASLMYAMFREAGIDARIVLVRTRRNGAILDLPASLAVFDHAIAYVPELDLYLDGTAEHSGTRELPAMDQGVTVLVVGPNEARLARTPILGPEHNRRARTIGVQLAMDGSASVEIREEIIGAANPGYRKRYAAAGTRTERFEQSLRAMFPGLDLESQRMENLDDLEANVRVTYRAQVPQFARRDGPRLSVRPTILHDLLRSLARTPTRRHTLDLGSTSSYTEDRTVRLPSGFHATDLPRGGEADSPFGRLHMTIEGSQGRVRVRTDFEVRRDRVTAAEYPAFRRWVQQADAILRQRIGVQGGEQ